MKERAYMYVPLVICKSMIHLRVCRGMMSLVFVILDSWYDRKSTGNNFYTNWCRWVLHESSKLLFFSHHLDAGTFVNHNICLYICLALYAQYV